MPAPADSTHEEVEAPSNADRNGRCDEVSGAIDPEFLLRGAECNQDQIRLCRLDPSDCPRRLSVLPSDWTSGASQPTTSTPIRATSLSPLVRRHPYSSEDVHAPTTSAATFASGTSKSDPETFPGSGSPTTREAHRIHVPSARQRSARP